VTNEDDVAVGRVSEPNICEVDPGVRLPYIARARRCGRSGLPSYFKQGKVGKVNQVHGLFDKCCGLFWLEERDIY
jgi:hypothetical protein